MYSIAIVVTMLFNTLYFFGGAIENDLIHTIGNADEQLDELNTMTRSSYRHC